MEEYKVSFFYKNIDIVSYVEAERLEPTDEREVMLKDLAMKQLIDCGVVMPQENPECVWVEPISW